jgi:glycosyltransferase involved in cell wall biosynthesis
VHYLHAAFTPNLSNAPLWFRVKERLIGRWYRRIERQALNAARIILTNSNRTTADVIAHGQIPVERVHTVYYGADPSWSPPSPAEQAAGRALFGLSSDRPIIVFVGGFGYDNRKGFDTLLAAWQRVSRDSGWDAELVMAGGGRAAAALEAWVKQVGLTSRVRLIGFTNRVFDLLAAADLLVSPVRYEPYGLNVQEAICRGVPAIVSAVAGVAEEYSPDLADALLNDPDNPNELAERLRCWRADPAGWRNRFATLSERLRSRTWDDMAREIIQTVTRATS